MTCDYVIWTNLTKLWPFVAAHILHVVGSCMESSIQDGGSDGSGE